MLGARCSQLAGQGSERDGVELVAGGLLVGGATFESGRSEVCGQFSVYFRYDQVLGVGGGEKESPREPPSDGVHIPFLLRVPPRENVPSFQPKSSARM